MTELEAWEALAEAWSDGRTTEFGFRALDGQACLCPSLHLLLMCEQIGAPLHAEMEQRIMRHVRFINRDPVAHNAVYMAPCDEDGARIRLEFCKQQIERLKEQVPT